MANQNTSLTLNIFARDRNAKRTLKDIGDQAEKTGNQVRGLNEMADALRLGALVAAIPALPSLAATVVGPMLALPALAGAGAAAMGTVALAMKGTSEQAEELKKDLEMVAPAWRGMANDANAALTGPLRGALQDLTDAYVPALSGEVEALAATLGETGRSLVDWATAPDVVAKVTRQFQLANDVTREFGRAAEAGLDVLLDLADAGADFTRWFVTRLADGVETFRDFIAQARASGQLAQIFHNSQVALEGLGGVLADVGSLLFDIFSNPAVGAGAEFLFGTIRAGLQILQTFVDLFAALPTPIQTTVVAIAGIGGAVALAFSALTRMRATVLSATSSLAGMGRAGEIAANGISRLARTAGTVGTIVVGLNLVGQGVDAIFGKGKIQAGATEASEALLEFAKSGQITGKMATAFQGDLGNLGEAIKSLEPSTLGGLGRGLVANLENLTGLQDTVEGFSRAADRISLIDQGLADLVRTGNAQAAEDALLRLAEAGRQAGAEITWEELIARFPAYREALAEIERGHREAKEGAEEHVGAAVELKEITIDNITLFDELRKMMERVYGPERDLMELQEEHFGLTDRFTEAVEKAKKAKDKEATSLSMSTQKGRENRDMLEDLYDNALETYLAIGKTQGIDAATRAYDTQKTKIDELARKLGFSKTQVEELYKRMAHPPKFPLITLPFQIKMQGWNPGNWFSWLTKAQGGVEFAEQGMIARSPTVVFGESAATRPEAYIPSRGISQSRGRSLVDTAAGWWGGAVNWGGQSGGGSPVVELRSSGNDVEEMLVAILRRAIHVRGGNVQVALGRR